ncbi:hypothetical protein NL533_30045, partial [Klebsiella pneumoniae]|nr:hypothetical protein [Klebsiella pneumoniae]
SNPALLLPTVLSRCRKIYFHPLAEIEVASYLTKHLNKTPTEAASLAAMSQGSIGQAVRLAKEGNSPLRQMLLDLLAQGGPSNYKQLSAAATQIAEG